MNSHADSSDEELEPDVAMHFYVFMMVFWPVSIALGLIDHYYMREYDLRIATLVLGALAGWAGMEIYKARERRQHEAAE